METMEIIAIVGLMFFVLVLMLLQHVFNMMLRSNDDTVRGFGVVLTFVSYAAMFGFFKLAIEVWGQCPQ